MVESFNYGIGKHPRVLPTSHGKVAGPVLVAVRAGLSWTM